LLTNQKKLLLKRNVVVHVVEAGARLLCGLLRWCARWRALRRRAAARGFGAGRFGLAVVLVVTATTATAATAFTGA
jgi:hypothetical protein